MGLIRSFKEATSASKLLGFYDTGTISYTKHGRPFNLIANGIPNVKDFDENLSYVEQARKSTEVVIIH